MSDRPPIVLCVDEGERLDEHEDESVTESREEGERQDDRLGKEHFEGTDPGNKDLFEGESLLEGGDFVGSVDVGVGAVLASLLGDPVHHNSNSGLGNKSKMGELNSATKDQLIPSQQGPVTIYTGTMGHTWIQMLQRQSRNFSENPPTTGPRTEPPTEEKTTKATAYC